MTLEAGQRRRHPSGRILTLKRVEHVFVEATGPRGFMEETIYSPEFVASWPMVERTPGALACPHCDDDVLATPAPGRVVEVACPNCKMAVWVDFSTAETRCSSPWLCSGLGPDGNGEHGCHKVEPDGRGCGICGAHLGFAWDQFPANIVNGNIGRWVAGKIPCGACGGRSPTLPPWQEPKEGECRCFALQGDALVAALRRELEDDAEGFDHINRDRAEFQKKIDGLEKRIAAALAELAGVGAPDGPVARARAILAGAEP